MCAVRRIMGGKKIFARSFSREEQKQLACGAFIGCFIIAINLCTVLKPYFGVPYVYFRVESMSSIITNLSNSQSDVSEVKGHVKIHDLHVESINPIITNLSNSQSDLYETKGDVKIQDLHVGSTNPIITNLSNSRSDVYEIKGDVRIHGTSSTIFIASSHNQNSTSWTIKPYAQRMDSAKIRRVTNFTIKMETADRIPHCNRNLSNIPAIVFSGRGHAENTFHAFADVLFPLFLTSHHFNRSILFLVTNQHTPWTNKYRAVLEKLSKYDVYDIDWENEVLCFSRMIVGLKSPKGFFMHPSESPDFPIGSFRKLLRRAYSLERDSVHDRNKTGEVSKPRMLIVSRDTSRKLMNENEVGNVARSLGFDVVVKPLLPDVSLTAKLVNSADVMIGVHGAGLTNMLFLPENATLIQITPFGLDIDAMVCYGWAAQSMKLRYLEYFASVNESAFFGKYPVDSEVCGKSPLDNEVCRDPDAVRKKRYYFYRFVYLDNQDVNVDLVRFRETLVRALEFLGGI